MRSYLNRSLPAFELVFIAALPIVARRLLQTAFAALTRQHNTTASCVIRGRDVESLTRLVNKYGGSVTSRMALLNSVGALLPADALPFLQQEAEVQAIAPNTYLR